MWDWQQGRCAICSKPEKYGVAGMVLDHDHETDLIRGYLCGVCNSAEGHSTADGRIINYRRRPPAVLLGIRLRRGRKGPVLHPGQGQLTFDDAL
jgi:hypothetical protein